MRDYRAVSYWLSTAGDLTPRPALPGDLDVDVAIVGGGYTGLWTAYYLAKADPSLRVVILEKEVCGFGASGRNGGWCSSLFAGSRERTARRHGRDAAVAMQRAMFATVDEVGKVIRAEDIDADWHMGGTITLVTAPAQLKRVRDSVDYERSWGFGEDDYRWLDVEEARARLNVEGLLGAAYSPHSARLHPGKLVRRLAEVVEGLDVRIYEQTAVESIEGGAVRTPVGTVRANIVVRATEAFTPRLDGYRRALAPIYSLMIATEPLPPSFWDAVGWADRETVNDGRHLVIYAQRTVDDRIAMGGRGAYHYGSRTDDSFDRDDRVFEKLREILISLMPAASDAAITHRWGGAVGVPRDWYTSIGLDRTSGVAWAGGYVGDGVSTANLAGRTLTDLILERDGDLVRLPWVGHRSPRWEPEPLRWTGITLGLRAALAADRIEQRTGRPTRLAKLLERLTSH